MQTITFYSYKGGVGRSLALVNVAKLLASLGKKVYVLDLDLEAPGLHYKLADEATRADLQKGFVDYAYDYFRGDGYGKVEDFTIKSTPNKYPNGGWVWLMPAGNSTLKTYWEHLLQIRWTEKVYDHEGEALVFLLELKSCIEEQCQPDVLLLDARTGVTEIGSAALTLLPDILVFLFVNNLESKEGTREIMRSIPRTFRELPKEVPPPPIIGVLTRIPEDFLRENETREELLQYLKEPSQDGFVPPLHPNLLVLHSNRDLEVEEQTYADKRGTLLYSEYKALLNALSIELDGKVATREEMAEIDINADVEEAEKFAGQNQWREANPKWENATRLAEQTYGKDSPKFVAILQKNAEALDERGNPADALAKWLEVEELLSVENRGKTAERILFAAVKSEQVEVCTDERLEAALAHVAKSGGNEATLGFLGELRRAFDSDKSQRTSFYAKLLRNIWSVQIEMGRLEEATTLIDEAVPHFLNQGEEGRLLWAHALYGRAQIAVKNADYLNALEPIQHTVDLFKFYNDQLLSAAQDLQAQILRACGRIREADKIVRDRPSQETRGRTMPAPTTLPVRIHRLTRSGPAIQEWSIDLDMVTPILGGAASTRDIDEIDVIRVPSLRGQLRFWWRVVHGGHLTPEQLYLAEREIFGATTDETGGRSNIEIHVDILKRGEIDKSDIGLSSPGAYALWPAREARGKNPQPTAPRRLPGTRFTLHVRCLETYEQHLRNALRAMILFGGYGGRTRRGTGSFAVARESDRALWLPESASREAFARAFGHDPFALSNRPADTWPVLSGAGMRVGATTNATNAWITALDWLREFRQGTYSGARVAGPDKRRPGRSNWPEPDKVRQLSGRGPWAHDPKHNAQPVWPRAGFGLPIVGRFQNKDRYGSPYRPEEPRDFEIRWYDTEGKLQDRLASPLIVKALPLANGQFVPCALWLHRRYPAGTVRLHESDSRAPRSKADFDMLVAKGESARFWPLEQARNAPQGQCLRTAFFAWLDQQKNIKVLAK